jgi:ClpP class serine protease
MQAAERKLVDHTGSLQDAIDAAARIAGLGDRYSVHWTEPELTTFERLVLEMTSGVMSRLNFETSAIRLVKKTFLQNLLDDLRILAEGQRGLTIAAHCLCGLD